MANLQEIYKNHVAVAAKEIEDAEKRYQNAILHYLCKHLPDEEVVKFIGDGVVYALIMINCVDQKDYELTNENGYADQITVDTEDIERIIDWLVIDKKADEYTLRVFKKIVRDYFEDYANHYNITELNGQHVKVGHHSIHFTDYEIDLQDGYHYAQSYCLKDKYTPFYERVKKVFKQHFEEIIHGNVNGKFEGLVDLVQYDSCSSTLNEELDVRYFNERSAYFKTQENRKNYLDKYIAKFVEPMLEEEAM